jgi:thiol-disulfide isomerase/thioredoxin
VTPDAIRSLAGDLENGVYIWRRTDRLLLPYRGNFAKESKTLLKTLNDNYQTKPFFAGYKLGKDDEASALEIEIMNEKAALFADDFTFVVIPTEEKFLKSTDLHRLAPPLFFCFQSENISVGRWFLHGDEAHDRVAIDEFLRGIQNGVLPFTVRAVTLPFEPPEVKLRQVNAITADEKLIQKDVVTLLLCAASWCGHCREFKPQIQLLAELLAEQPIQFFWINEPENDHPKTVPPDMSYPALFMWPVGENYMRPLQFEQTRSVRNVLEWIHANGGVRFAIPEITDEEIEKRITEIKQNSTF